MQGTRGDRGQKKKQLKKLSIIRPWWKKRAQLEEERQEAEERHLHERKKK